MSLALHRITAALLWVALLGCHPSTDRPMPSAQATEPAPSGLGVSGQPPLVAAIFANDYGRLLKLLDAGADLQQADLNGKTAVHWAAMHESYMWLRALLKHGADPNVADTRTQQRPLMSAIMSHREANLKLLLAAGADPNARDSSGFTSLHTSAATRHADYSLLLQAGADPLARNVDGAVFQDYQWMGWEPDTPDLEQERKALKGWLRAHHVPEPEPRQP